LNISVKSRGFSNHAFISNWQVK